MHALRIEEGEREEKKGKLALLKLDLALLFSLLILLPLQCHYYIRAHISLFSSFLSAVWHTFFTTDTYYLLRIRTVTFASLFLGMGLRDEPWVLLPLSNASARSPSSLTLYIHTYLSIWDHSLLRIGFIALVWGYLSDSILRCRWRSLQCVYIYVRYYIGT